MLDYAEGENADIYRWAFFYGPLWLMEVLVAVNLVRIWVYVRDITKRAENQMYGDRSRAKMDAEASTSINFDVSSVIDMPNSSSPNSSVSRLRRTMSSRRLIDSARHSQFAKRRKQVANQCFRYGGAFYFTWIPITVRNSDNNCVLASMQYVKEIRALTQVFSFPPVVACSSFVSFKQSM